MTQLLMAAALMVAGDPEPIQSYLYQPAYSIDFIKRCPARPYCPQPGDIMLATDQNLFWKITHNLGGTGHPHHSGVVFQRRDGSLAILEGGPHDTARIRTLEWYSHLCSYEAKGRVWIRQRKCPITPEQSERLTCFAEQQEGKWFALGRLGLQLTGIRTRGPIRTKYIGHPYGPDRHSFFCSECAVEAIVYAGLVDPACARPSATYPRDIFMDKSCNPWLNKHFKLCDSWYPPALFTACPKCVAPEATAPIVVAPTETLAPPKQ